MFTVDQKEIEALYWRFRSLDRGRKGFVTEDELLAIPGMVDGLSNDHITSILEIRQ